MSTLDNFLAHGFIDQFDYVELAPRNVVPFADRLKKRWSDRDEQMNIMRQQVMQEMQAQGMPLPGMEQPTGVEGAPLPQIPHAPGLPPAGR
jgi:hypothetical protein